MIFESISQIVIYEGNITIDQDGVILGATKAEHKNSILYIGDENSGGSVTICNGFMNFSGNSYSNIGGSNGTVLSGPRSTRITINGIATTYGEIMDRHQGVSQTAAAVVVPVYQLAESCELNKIECSGGGTLESIDPRWLSKRVTVNVRGSGKILLPGTEFISINANVAGSGDVCGDDTDVQILNVSVAGSGDVRGFHITNSGSISVAGSGDVDVTAEHPSQVSRNVAGSGDINVKKRNTKKPKLV